MSNNWTMPLKRNWRSGTPQTAAFLRTAEGGTISCVQDRATPIEQQLVLWLVGGAHKMSPELKEKLRAEWIALSLDRTKIRGPII
jgi:hypothetical protein